MTKGRSYFEIATKIKFVEFESAFTGAVSFKDSAATAFSDSD